MKLKTALPYITIPLAVASIVAIHKPTAEKIANLGVISDIVQTIHTTRDKFEKTENCAMLNAAMRINLRACNDTDNHTLQECYEQIAHLDSIHSEHCIPVTETEPEQTPDNVRATVNESLGARIEIGGIGDGH